MRINHHDRDSEARSEPVPRTSDPEHIPDEDQITPEMIRVGAWAAVSHDPTLFSWEEIAAHTYRAMRAARNKASFAVNRPQQPSPVDS